jgi:hypothetical protein
MEVSVAEKLVDRNTGLKSADFGADKNLAAATSLNKHL